MDPGDFTNTGIAKRSFTFRACVKYSTDIGCNRFQIFSDGPLAGHLVDEGVLKITVERALFLQIHSGRTFVAYKVNPILGHDGTQSVLVVDIRADNSPGQMLWHGWMECWW